VIADTLSRLGRKKDITPIVGKNDAPSKDTQIDSLDNFFSTFDEEEMVECFNSVLSTENNLLQFVEEHDCFLNLAAIEKEENPLNLESIKENQDADEELQKLRDKHPDRYFIKEINQTQDVFCYVKPGKDKDEYWKIVIPTKLLMPTIKWYHIVTGHSGWNRLYMTIGARYYHPALKTEVRRFRCDACQKHKLPGK